MPARSLLPPEFSWLSPDFRPSPQEVKAYAAFINSNAAELNSPDRRASLREAELQLWIWRTETRQPPPRRRRTAPPSETTDGLLEAAAAS